MTTRDKAIHLNPAINVIWVNGAFGVGKSTTVSLLCKELANSVVFDPEVLGHGAWPKESSRTDDFQDNPLWRRLVVSEIIRLARTGKTVIVPMTVLRPDYINELMRGLNQANVKVLHVTLDASVSTLRARIVGDNVAANTLNWRLNHIADYVSGREFLRGCSRLVSTENHDPIDICEEILSLA